MNILYVLSMPSHPNQVVKGGCPLKMTRLNKYKENLYKELGEFHMFNEDTKNEIITLLQLNNVTTSEGMMQVVFDYAFKCGIKKALKLIEDSS